MGPTRRVKALEISADVMLEIMKTFDGSKRIAIKGLPKDARCVGVHAQQVFLERPKFNTLFVLVESETFNEVPDGQEPPVLELQVVSSSLFVME